MESTTGHKRTTTEFENGEPSRKKLKTDDGKNAVEGEERKEDGECSQQQDIKNRNEEESQFLRLLTLILNLVISIKDVENSAVAESIQEIKNSFKVQSGPFLFSTIDFTKWENICGYLFRYGSHGAGFSRCRTLNAVRNCEDLKCALRKSDLRIVCLGSGPGNDAVGLCSALSEVEHPRNMNITLVDKFEEWELCVKIAKVLISKENFGMVSDLFQKSNVSLSFIKVDLPGDSTTDSEYFRSLGEADIIVMSKLVSILDSGIVDALIQSLYENMKKGAFILLGDVFMTTAWSRFECLYCSGYKEEDRYKSSVSAERRFNCEDDSSSKLPITVLRKKI